VINKEQTKLEITKLLNRTRLEMKTV